VSDWIFDRPWVLLVLTVVFAVAVLLFCDFMARRDPCARWVTGTVSTTDDQGRPAQLEHTWCAAWKPEGGTR